MPFRLLSVNQMKMFGPLGGGPVGTEAIDFVQWNRGFESNTIATVAARLLLLKMTSQ